MQVISALGVQMINEQIDPPAAAFEILVETHDLDLDRLPYNALFL